METDIHELTAGYALDALDPAEREAFEQHLAGCRKCQEDLAAFWDVSGSLAVAAAGPAPSPELRERILADARADKQTVTPIVSRRRITPVLAAATAVAAAIAIGIGIYATSLSRQLDDTRSALTSQETATAVLADPAATTVAMESGSGRVVVTADGAAVLVVDDLAAAPAGKTYQAWVVVDQAPVSAGTFDTSDQRAIVPLAAPVPEGAVVGVTVENAGGASSPTLPMVAASAPA